jgi:3-hydroxyisobutyrate dehydrogenase-like beta-hydroxyacid dehydrogenase
MAANLLEAGQPLIVHNRTAEKAAALTQRGARFAATPAEVAVPGGVVISVLWDAQATEAVMGGEGVLERLGPDGLHVCMCTGAPEALRRLAARHAAVGCAMVAAPVFGRPDAAEARQLWIPMSGAEAAKGRGRPLLTAMGARGVFDFGEDVGAAEVVKIAGNFLIIAAARAMGEAVAIAARSGVDPAALVQMLTSTLFPAPVYQAYGRLAAAGTTAMAASPIPAKDLSLFQALAREAGTRAPLAALLESLVTG